jgi:hypothetical protein
MTKKFTCGERGIRTPGTVTSTTVFETVPFDRSGSSPFKINANIKNLSYFGLNNLVDTTLKIV